MAKSLLYRSHPGRSLVARDQAVGLAVAPSAPGQRAFGAGITTTAPGLSSSEAVRPMRSGALHTKRQPELSSSKCRACVPLAPRLPPYKQRVVYVRSQPPSSSSTEQKGRGWGIGQWFGGGNPSDEYETEYETDYDTEQDAQLQPEQQQLQATHAAAVVAGGDPTPSVEQQPPVEQQEDVEAADAPPEVLHHASAGAVAAALVQV